MKYGKYLVKYKNNYYLTVVRSTLYQETCKVKFFVCLTKFHVMITYHLLN
jgi:hypothetical protein